MTAQINDIFKFNGVEYVIVGIDQSEIFDPIKEGFEPKSASTACWRVYYLTFNATDMYLFLEEMQINQDKAKKFNGIDPIKGDFFFSHKYLNMKYKISYTGKILIAKDFIDSMYVHMGFQRPMAYKTVIELIIKEGDVLEVLDHSDMFEKRRNEDSKKDATPLSSSETDIKDFVEKSFSREYDIDK